MNPTTNTATPPVPAELGPVRIHRTVTFDLATFDHLKAWHRHLSATRERELTNSEALRVLILAHPAP